MEKSFLRSGIQGFFKAIGVVTLSQLFTGKISRLTAAVAILGSAVIAALATARDVRALQRTRKSYAGLAHLSCPLKRLPFVADPAPEDGGRLGQLNRRLCRWTSILNSQFSTFFSSGIQDFGKVHEEGVILFRLFYEISGKS